MGFTERSKALYQPWNQEGFNADLYVRKMTNVQRWIYKTLLQEAFVCSTRPRIPNDDEILWIMADCESKEQWLENKYAVLRMFEEDDGLLIHRRLEEDWQRISDKRLGKVESGRKGAEKRWGKPKVSDSNAMVTHDVTMANDSKGSEEKEEVSEGEEMKADKQIAVLSQQAFGKSRTRLYGRNQEDLNLLILAHKGSAVIRAFADWVEDNEDDPDISDAIAAFVRVSDSYLSAEPRGVKVTADPAVNTLVGELAYLTGNVIGFDDRAKVRLAKVLETYRPEEVLAVFREWFDNLDTSNPKNVSFGGKNFSETAEQFLYAYRKRRQIALSDAQDRAATVQRLQEEAEANRLAAEAVKQEEAELFDPLA